MLCSFCYQNLITCITNIVVTWWDCNNGIMWMWFLIMMCMGLRLRGYNDENCKVTSMCQKKGSKCMKVFVLAFYLAT